MDPSGHAPVPYSLSVNYLDSSESIPSRQLFGVFQTPIYGDLAYTSQWAYSETLDQNGYLYQIQHYTDLIAASGTGVVDVYKIHPVPGSPAQYLQLLLNQKGFYRMVTYDTFTDTYFSNAAAAASTNVMLAYTWGICNDNVTRSLVEITFSNDYSNVCKEGGGLYYQSPNEYFSIPYACLGIAYDKLLTDCPDIKANMKALVDSTCKASIRKLCQQQYDLNPPFSCVTYLAPSPLSVLSLAFSNTMALSTLLAAVVAALLSRMHKNYKATALEMALANPEEGEEEGEEEEGRDFQPGKGRGDCVTGVVDDLEENVAKNGQKKRNDAIPLSRPAITTRASVRIVPTNQEQRDALDGDPVPRLHVRSGRTGIETAAEMEAEVVALQTSHASALASLERQQAEVVAMRLASALLEGIVAQCESRHAETIRGLEETRRQHAEIVAGLARRHEETERQLALMEARLEGKGRVADM